MTNEEKFWSVNSLKSKLDLWDQKIVENIILPMLELKSNEVIYDIGAGFSPLGYKLYPYILPSGHITGFDIDRNTVDSANKFVKEQHLTQYLTFKLGDIFQLTDQNILSADLVMCQQLLVNIPDYVTALEYMMDLTKSTGRILCIENINYGAYVHRPDFSWRANLRLSQIWQQLCIAGKFGQDHAASTVGALLPQIFDQLGLKNIQYVILNPSNFPQPPYSEHFISSFTKSYKQEKMKLKRLITKIWAPNTDLPDEDIDFFVENVIDSEYDLHAIKNNLYLTQWFYPLMVIVGWLQEKILVNKKIEQNIQLDVDL